jgi:hypothetical protein
MFFFPFRHVFHKLSLSYKRKFLVFATGNDRIPPISGLKGIKLYIQPCGTVPTETQRVFETLSTEGLTASDMRVSSASSFEETPSARLSTDDRHLLNRGVEQGVSRKRQRSEDDDLEEEGNASECSSSLPSASTAVDVNQYLDQADTECDSQLHSTKRPVKKPRVSEAPLLSKHPNPQSTSANMTGNPSVIADSSNSENPYIAALDSSLNDYLAPGTLDEGRLLCAHTCTHVLDLPFYRTVERLADCMVYALDNAGEFQLV